MDPFGSVALIPNDQITCYKINSCKTRISHFPDLFFYPLSFCFLLSIFLSHSSQYVSFTSTFPLSFFAFTVYCSCVFALGSMSLHKIQQK